MEKKNEIIVVNREECGNDIVNVQPKIKVTGEWRDSEVVGVALVAYQSTCLRFLKEHNCGEPNCDAEELHRNILAFIKSEMKRDFIKRGVWPTDNSK